MVRPLQGQRSTARAACAVRRCGDIDAEALSASLDPAGHGERADSYFGADLDGPALADARRSHLIKPFHDPGLAALHLAAFADLLGGLDVEPGMTVLDFGCGAGWTSRLIAQLGCHVILCDVSPGALETAAIGFVEHPPIVPPGTPDPTFLVFDGHRVDVADASVDRVFCFDAFHHVPNHPEVLRELSRILAPEGVAGFHEPGPDHSREAASQFEMRNFGFLERDVLLGPIWESAQQAGFRHLRLSLPGPTLTHLDLGAYDRVLKLATVPLALRRRLWHAAGATRLFYLFKGDPPDSASRDELSGELRLLGVVEPPGQDQVLATVRVENTGRRRWRRPGPSGERSTSASTSTTPTGRSSRSTGRGWRSPAPASARDVRRSSRSPCHGRRPATATSSTSSARASCGCPSAASRS